MIAFLVMIEEGVVFQCLASAPPSTGHSVYSHTYQNKRVTIKNYPEKPLRNLRFEVVSKDLHWLQNFASINKIDQSANQIGDILTFIVWEVYT